MAVEAEGLLVKPRGTPGGFATVAAGLGAIDPILGMPAGTGAGERATCHATRSPRASPPAAPSLTAMSPPRSRPPRRSPPPLASSGPSRARTALPHQAARRLGHAMYCGDPAIAGTEPFAASLRALANAMAVGGGAMRVSEHALAPLDLADGMPLAGELASERVDDHDSAFLSRRYAGPAGLLADVEARHAPTLTQDWRRIDGHWLGLAAEVALRLKIG